MAAGTSAGELAGRYRRLAALVEELEADGYDVVDAEPTEDEHGRQHAAVQLNLDGGLDAEPFRADGLEEGTRETASISSTCNGDAQNEEFTAGDEIDDSADQSETGDEDEVEEVWCGICGQGPFEMLSIHHGRVHEGNQIALDHEPSAAELVKSDEQDQGDDAVDEPEEDEPAAVEDVPDYEGPDPEATVAESSLSAHIVLDNVLDACVDATRADAPVVACVTDELGVHSDAVVPVLQALGLKQEDRRMLVDDVGAQVAAIRQEVSDEQ